MINIELNQSFHYCPPLWKNFFISECSIGPVDKNGDIEISFINEKLSQWGAIFCETNGIVFENEQDKLMFTLRWA